MSRATVARCLALLIFCVFAHVLSADQPAPGSNPAYAVSDVTTVPPEAQPSARFNVEAATDAYLAKIPAAAKARSDAYFEGGYWLILWDFLYGAIIALILLQFGWSAAMRNLAERLTPFGPLRTALYWIQYLIVISILAFPLAVYEGYFREH